MQVLNTLELSQVNGGHGGPFEFLGTYGLPIVIAIEFIHFIEAYNYTFDWITEGCSTVNEGDYFKQHVCSLIKEVHE